MLGRGTRLLVVCSVAQRPAVVAWLLIAYSLAYPAINAVEHHNLSRIPLFGVPCPTTILTAGLLILATPHSWRFAIIPVIWSVIGGSAAPLLGIHADYALPFGGIALGICLLQKSLPSRDARGRHAASVPDQSVSPAALS